MPRAKKSSPTKKKISSRQAKQDEQSLLEFEDFISQKPQKTNSRYRAWLVSFLLILIIVLGFLFIYNWQRPSAPPAEQKFQAIYLENSEVYYAKVAREDAFNIYLDEVYYIQMQEQLVPLDEEGLETETISVPILLKRGSELHQPVGWMQVNRNKVIAIEEIGGDSEILKEINRQKNQ